MKSRGDVEKQITFLKNIDSEIQLFFIKTFFKLNKITIDSTEFRKIIKDIKFNNKLTSTRHKFHNFVLSNDETNNIYPLISFNRYLDLCQRNKMSPKEIIELNFVKNNYDIYNSRQQRPTFYEIDFDVLEHKVGNEIMNFLHNHRNKTLTNLSLKK